MIIHCHDWIQRLGKLLIIVGGLWLLSFGWSPFPCLAATLPQNSGAINVLSYGAKTNGVTDSTQALQRALAEREKRFVYLPNGTYLVCGTLKWGVPQKRRILQGQSRDKTIIRLRDNCPGFGNPADPKPVISIYEGNKTAVAFRNAIYDLTIDVGKGNPGAIAVNFINNNQGGMRNVSLRSSDPQRRGAIGLALTQAWPGPGLIKQVQIIGFDYGIQIRQPEYSMVFEDITLQRQRILGIDNRANILSIHNIKSDNAVPVIQNSGDGRGLIVIVDGDFTGGSAAETAIANRQGVLYARNIQTRGYRAAIASGKRVIPGQTITEFVSHNIYNLFPTPSESLRLAIEPTPALPEEDVNQWANVLDYGAKQGFKADATAGIQRAIDSGKSTVYFPSGAYRISDTLYVRGNVQRIIGMESALLAKGAAFEQPAHPVFRIEGNQPSIVLERFWSMYGSNAKYWVEQATQNTLVLKNLMMGGYRNLTPGRLFIEDVTAGPWEFNRQNVWARQLNPEGNQRKILNRGGSLWLLGLKTEDQGTAIETRDGGKTEVLGGLLYPGSEQIPPTQPAFLNDQSQLSVVIGESRYGGSGHYQTVVSESRDGETKSLMADKLLKRGNGFMLPLYVGYKRAQNTAVVAPDNPDNPSEQRSPNVFCHFINAVVELWRNT